MSASTSKSGASPPKRGRPRNEEGITRIKLKKDVFQCWLARKNSLGFSTKTHSEFAMYLLLNFTDDVENGELSCSLWRMSCSSRRLLLLLEQLFVNYINLSLENNEVFC
jgi:hypothetical protein